MRRAVVPFFTSPPRGEVAAKRGVRGLFKFGVNLTGKAPAGVLRPRTFNHEENEEAS
jgi:hypothetical protein